MCPERGTKSLDIFQHHSDLENHRRESLVAPVCTYTDDFEENISEEIIDNVRRIRHHPCLGLWCGNNEMESQTIQEDQWLSGW